MSTPVSSTFDGLASVDRYGNLAPIVVDRLDERYLSEMSVPATDSRVAAILADATSQIATTFHATAESRDAVSAADPRYAGGMRTTKTGAQNKAALVAATKAAQALGGEVRIPAGRYVVDPIRAEEFYAGAPSGAGSRTTQGPVMWRGAGSAFHADNRRASYNSSTWTSLTMGPQGTVLVASEAVTAGTPWFELTDNAGAEGSTMADLAIVGRGVGVGVRHGWIAKHPLKLNNPADGGGWPVRQRWSNVSIANFEVGYQSTTENSVFSGLLLMACKVGLATGRPFNGNVFLGLNVEKCAEIGVLLTHSTTNYFLGGVIQSSDSLLGQVVIEQASFNNVFQNFYIETAKSNATAENPYVAVTIGGTNYWNLTDNRGPACNGNQFIDCHWDFHTQHAVIRAQNANNTILRNGYSKSTLTSTPPSVPPKIELLAGKDHRVEGEWPQGVTGNGVANSYININGQPSRLPSGIITTSITASGPVKSTGVIKPGEVSRSALPDPDEAGRGALIYEAQRQTLMVALPRSSDGKLVWAPLGETPSYANGTGGAFNIPNSLSGAADWRTRVSLASAASVVLPDPGTRPPGYKVTIRTKAGAAITSEGSGATVNGASSWTSPGGAVTFTVTAATGWETW